ncbi:MAG: HAD family hydrolase [Phycisphaerae bacterium]|nr:HAD family hydrolase [Phycisphaerae bacterium]
MPQPFIARSSSFCSRQQLQRGGIHVVAVTGGGEAVHQIPSQDGPHSRSSRFTALTRTVALAYTGEMKEGSPQLHRRGLSGVTPVALVACDLDGTLIGRDHHRIHSDDVAAIRRLRKAGVHFAICTGRSIIESNDVLSELQLQGPGVFVTGAVVADMADRQTLHRRTLPAASIARLIDFFSDCGHASLALIDEDASPAPYYVLTSHGPVHPATAEWFVRNRVQARETAQLDGALQRHVVRIGIVVDRPEAPRIEAELRRNFGTEIYFLSIKAPLFDSHVIEVFHPAVSKWTGITTLCQQLNLAPESVAAIGDDVNDIPMLRQAHISFAMASADEHVKAAAKRTTLPQTQGGVAAAITELFDEGSIVSGRHGT